MTKKHLLMTKKELLEHIENLENQIEDLNYMLDVYGERFGYCMDIITVQVNSLNDHLESIKRTRWPQQDKQF